MTVILLLTSPNPSSQAAMATVATREGRRAPRPSTQSANVPMTRMHPEAPTEESISSPPQRSLSTPVAPDMRRWHRSIDVERSGTSGAANAGNDPDQEDSKAVSTICRCITITLTLLLFASLTIIIFKSNQTEDRSLLIVALIVFFISVFCGSCLMFLRRF